MTVNDLYEIADRIERLAFEADGFNKPLKLVLAEICDLAEELRDEAGKDRHASEAKEGGGECERGERRPP